MRKRGVLQVDEEPSIRANTTVLLGNIAPVLGPTVCKRVLLNAFGRALRDVYPPSRAAALRALVATSVYHPPQAVAARVVPSISPLMLDPQADVRKAAIQVSILSLHASYLAMCPRFIVLYGFLSS
jgi:SCY1-like protein 1